MALWSDELEAMRPQLREEADAFIASFASELDDPSLPVAERVAKQRAVADERVLRSEMAVDREISGPAGPLRLRTFVPDQVDAVFLHIHGGGFVTGSPEMTDLLHEILSKELNLAFVSVDYRLAPEHTYPAGPDDCEAAALWLLEHAEREFGSARLLIGGESAGAHLAGAGRQARRQRPGRDDCPGTRLAVRAPQPRDAPALCGRQAMGQAVPAPHRPGTLRSDRAALAGPDHHGRQTRRISPQLVTRLPIRLPSRSQISRRRSIQKCPLHLP